MVLSCLECGAEALLPITNGFLLGRCEECRIDRLTGFERGIHDRIRLGRRVKVTDIILGVDRIDDLYRLRERTNDGWLVVIREDYELPKVAACDVGEKVLECFRIVRKAKRLVCELSQNELDHEGL